MNENNVEISRGIDEEENEIDLIEIFSFAQKHIVKLTICTALGVLGGVATYAYLPSKWEADVTLQIGKIPILKNFDYVDSPPEVVEKIKSPLFLSKMVSLMYGKDVAPDSPTGRLLYKDLNASLIRGNNLVIVRVFGWTADEAYKNAGILGESIVAEYRAMADPYLSGAQNRLKDVTASIERNQAVLAKVNAIEQSAPSKNEANALLKVALIDAKATEIQKLKAERAQLEEILSAARLQTTSIVGRSLVPQYPSSPKRGPLIIGGAFIGLLLGLLLSFGSLVRNRRRANP